MKNKLQIIELGNPILREVALPVVDFHDEKIQKLIDDLLKLIIQINEVGVSVPQIGKSLRLSIIASHPNPRYPYAPHMKPTVMINPKIISASEQKVKDWEGCLSIPGIMALVPRHKTITVEYINRQGKIIKVEYADFVARIFQHEYDHFEGMVFLDRIENNIDIFSEKEFQKLIKERRK